MNAINLGDGDGDGDLEQRLRLLQTRSALLRAEISMDAAQINASLDGMRRSYGIARRLISVPVLAAAASMVLLSAGPRRLSVWAGRAIVGLSLLRRIRRLFRR